MLDAALHLAEQELLRGGRGITWNTAKRVRDAAMLGMVLGHVGLTLRISVVCSLKASVHSSTPCDRCDRPSCHGNMLLELEEVGEEETLKHALRVPHHKTQRSGIAMPIIRVHSAKLNKLIKIWQNHGRSKLVVAEQDPLTLFVTNTGRPFTGLSAW